MPAPNHAKLAENENGWQGCCQPLRFYEGSRRLVTAVSAAVRASTAAVTAAWASAGMTATRTAIMTAPAAKTVFSVFVATVEEKEIAAPVAIAAPAVVVAAAVEGAPEVVTAAIEMPVVTASRKEPMVMFEAVPV